MDLIAQWGEALSSASAQVLQRLTLYLPNILGAFLLLIIGWFVARLLRAVAVRAAGLLERGLARVPAGRVTGRVRLPGASASILGSIIFWVVLLFFLTAATQVLGLTAFTAWLARTVDYLPTLIAGALIILAGFLVSRFVREVLEATTTDAESKQRRLLAQAAQAAILVTAILVGADQIGIKITILVVIAATLAAALVGAVTLALSLGARSYVANLIGGHYLRQTYRVGQRVRVAGFEGKILDLTSTAVVLETSDGRANVPAKVFNEEAITLLVGSRDDA
jgi:small-conductance mechanosensitive channel